VNAGAIKFGSYIDNPYVLQDLPFFLLMGVFGGLLGSMFVHVNYNIGKFRKQYINTSPYKKIAETLFWVFLTATIMYFSPLIIQSDCLPIAESKISEEQALRYMCPDGQYNPLATLLFNPLGKVFKFFLSPNVFINYNPLLIYFVIWYVLAIFTLGTNVPAGLFVSGILIGCSFGRLLGLFL
jgi:chloride channel 7